MNSKRIAGVSICAVSLVIPLSAVATTWEPTAANHDGQELHVLHPFEDGVATEVTYAPTNDPWVWSADADWILANSSDPSKTGMLFSFSRGAPYVNWAHQTIDVGGMYIHGVNGLENTGTGQFDGWIFEERIGWSVAPSVWGYDVNWDFARIELSPFVPLIDNGDGTYTASWSYANDVFGPVSSIGPYGEIIYTYNLNQMSLTFQTAVPEPDPRWFFLIGLCVVSMARWGKKAEIARYRA